MNLQITKQIFGSKQYTYQKVKYLRNLLCIFSVSDCSIIPRQNRLDPDSLTLEVGIPPFGEGKFGIVFKGHLQLGSERVPVAVKQAINWPFQNDILLEAKMMLWVFRFVFITDVFLFIHIFIFSSLRFYYADILIIPWQSPWRLVYSFHSVYVRRKLRRNVGKNQVIVLERKV